MSVKVQFAVTFANEYKHYREIFSKEVTAKDLLGKFAREFGIDGSQVNEYSLIVHVKDERPFYLNESHIPLLPRIYMIDLCPAVETEVTELKNQLASNNMEVVKGTLVCLTKRLLVEEFVRNSIEHCLHMELFKLVEKLIENEELSVLIMKIFAELVLYTNRKEDSEEIDDKPFISWLNVKSETIKSTLEYCKTSQNFNGIDSSLKVLVRYVSQKNSLSDLIYKTLDCVFIFGLFESLHKNSVILRNLKWSIQISLISLINCSLITVKDSKDKFIEKLHEYFGDKRLQSLKEKIDIIGKNLREFPSALRPAWCGEPTKEEHDFIEELTKLQYFILLPVYWDATENQSNRPVDTQDLILWKQLMTGSILESDVHVFEKLGFQNPKSPSQDFLDPYGHLVFYCMKRLLLHYFDEVRNIFTKRGPNDISFVKIVFSLVRVLDRAIQLSEVIEDNLDGGIYLPILFHTCDLKNDLSKGFFYDLFQKCFFLYVQSSVDLKLNEEELEEYFLNQINEVFNCYPTSFKDFNSWLERVRGDNTRKKKLEAHIMEWESSQFKQNPNIKELKAELEAEYNTLVSKKRIYQMKERPYSFELRTAKNIQRYSLQLDDSHSIIIAKEESDPNSKVNKWPISSLKNFSTDKPNFSQKKDNTYYFSFTMTHRDSGTKDEGSASKVYNFSCSHKKNYAVWVDGLNILFNKPPKSQEFKDEVSNLVRMEMKIRFILLTKENIHHEAPALPSLPDNYNFVN